MDVSDSPDADPADAVRAADAVCAADAAGADRDRDADGMLAEQLLRLTRRLHRIQSRQLEPIGITPAQFRLLRTVASYDAAPGWRISPSAWTWSRAP